MMLQELTLPMLLALLPKLDATHRAEILRTHADLERWAVDRVTLPGVAWALFDGEEIVAAGGVVSEGVKGTLWLAGAVGWQRYVLHPVRIFRGVIEAKVYREFECQCSEDNLPAQRFAEYLGFSKRDVRDGLVNYARSA